MKKIDQSDATEFWDNQVEKFGDSYRALDYGSKETQEKKFQILSEVGDLNNKSILDVGCGFGDLFEFLTGKGIEVEYHGVDISPRMIEEAKKKRPELNIEVLDILSTADEEKYDYVLTTGFNCHKTDNNEMLEKMMIGRMFELCRIGAAVGLLSCHSPTFDPDGNVYFSDPEALLKFCVSDITKWVTLRHDYMPHDFTIYLYKIPII